MRKWIRLGRWKTRAPKTFLYRFYTLGYVEILNYVQCENKSRDRYETSGNRFRGSMRR